MKPLGVNYRRVASIAKGIYARLSERRLLLLLVLLATALYSAVSILRHLHFWSGWDVLIFDQGVWQYSRFHAPIVTGRTNFPINHLGDHFHPIIALLAPLFWIFNGAEALLVGQALVVALSIVPVFLFTERRLGKEAAWLFALSYSIFWAVQRTVEFEFHEIAFAIPLIAFAIYFIDLRKAKGYFACFALLLLTKENLPALVAFFGLYLLLLKRYRDGLISLALGLATFPLIKDVVIPFFSGDGYNYWSYDALGPNLSGAIKTMMKRPGLVLSLLVSPAVKLRTIWLIFSPYLALPFFSPLIVLFIPVFAERFLSSKPTYWEPIYHYNAVVAPLVALAAADGLSRLAKLLKSERARRAGAVLPGVAILLINLYLLPGLPLWQLTSPAYWRLTDTERDGYAAMSVIPPDATVTTQTNIASHLAHRRGIFTISPNSVSSQSAYIIAARSVVPDPLAGYQEIEDYLARQQQRGYLKVFDRGGWVVLKRPDVALDAPPVLLTEEGSSRAAAVDSVKLQRGPFSVTTDYPLYADGFTRVSLFVFNVEAEYPLEPSDIEVTAEDAQGRAYAMSVEAASPVEGRAGLVQVNIRLPAELKGGGDVWVSIKAHGLTSNKALINLLPDQH
jgi:uncharacterized membrane protein